MGRKCIIHGCKSINDIRKAANCKLKERNDAGNNDRIPVFGFPSETKFPEERRRLIKVLPLLDKNTINSYKTPPVICLKHWPNYFENKKGLRGQERP